MSTKHSNDEEMGRLITELLKAWNTHDLERITSFYAPDYEGMDISEARPQQGPAGIRQSIARYLQAFPDLHFTEEWFIAQGDRLALAWMAQGTHQGMLMNIPATGHYIQVRGVSLLTLVDGKIKQGLYIWDVAGLLRNIGLLPELPEA